ncbi:MAG: Y4yA family PLP-dependent enzyme [Pirellulaceae bacterium]|nr:Y4yA family PLP-dependent enzyme [Pirellulaceae bacterium]
MQDLCYHDRLEPWITKYGSPLNLLSAAPLKRNIRQLDRVANERQLRFRVYFARKANKCLTLVDAAAEVDAGVDTASEVELQQVLDRGFDPARIICTAAVKSRHLMQQCVDAQVVVAVDNLDELHSLRAVATTSRANAPIALRISGFSHAGEKLPSRFGFDVDDLLSIVQENWASSSDSPLAIRGIHFHLDGYCLQQRVSAIRQLLSIIDQLRQWGHAIDFLDIGGGIPMSYLESAQQWEAFWTTHDDALLGNRSAITYQNHGLGRIAIGDQVHGERNVYPYYQQPVQHQWLERLLDSPLKDLAIDDLAVDDVAGNVTDAAAAGSSSLANALRNRQLELRCEPGRSVLDGCGMTVARVEFRKQHPDGHWLIGLSMNRTQCRTTTDDFLVDPILVRRQNSGVSSLPVSDDDAMEGYLVGAYCTESELLSLRRLRFPQGVSTGDLFVFPNTAGYLMHFLESRSHQFLLAKNGFVDGDAGSLSIDPIDQPIAQ